MLPLRTAVTPGNRAGRRRATRNGRHHHRRCSNRPSDPTSSLLPAGDMHHRDLALKLLHGSGHAVGALHPDPVDAGRGSDRKALSLACTVIGVGHLVRQPTRACRLAWCPYHVESERGMLQAGIFMPFCSKPNAPARRQIRMLTVNAPRGSHVCLRPLSVSSRATE